MTGPDNEAPDAMQSCSDARCRHARLNHAAGVGPCRMNDCPCRRFK